jgi:GGDEF domain-containing protein
MAQDVTARRELESRLSHQAYHDPLTGLANRARLRDRLERALVLDRRDPRAVALIYVDLDDCKKVNDSLGHAAGDRLLPDRAGGVGAPSTAYGDSRSRTQPAPPRR